MIVVVRSHKIADIGVIRNIKVKNGDTNSHQVQLHGLRIITFTPVQLLHSN